MVETSNLFLFHISKITIRDFDILLPNRGMAQVHWFWGVVPKEESVSIDQRI